MKAIERRLFFLESAESFKTPAKRRSFEDFYSDVINPEAKAVQALDCMYETETNLLRDASWRRQRNT